MKIKKIVFTLLIGVNFASLYCPYTTNKQLPLRVKNHLPDRAQTIYRKAFNAAYEEYQDPAMRHEDLERVASRVAWSAVKKKYQKEDGAWVSKESKKSY